MKICINYGHALDGPGTGAVGLKKESEETRVVGKDVVKLLKDNSKHEILVADFEGEDNYVKAVKFANSNNVDLFVSIHFNSGANDYKGNEKTTGTEVLIGHIGSSAYDEAQRISKGISELGLKNRGVKLRPDLYVLRNTNMGACLVECAFLDDADDMNVYNPKLMAKAIAEGILNKDIKNNEEELDMNKIVLYYGDVDLFSAVLVSQKHQCPLMKKQDFDAAKLKAKEIIQIGGNKEDSNRFTTMKNAYKYL